MSMYHPPPDYDGAWWPELGPHGRPSRFWDWYMGFMVIGWFLVIPGTILELLYYWHCTRMCKKHGWVKQ